MPNYTSKLNLIKPIQGVDKYDVNEFNSNADKIDQFATATDSQLAEIEQQIELPLTNLITNGDFSNGTTGWSTPNAIISAVSNTLTLQGTTGSSEPRVIQEVFTIGQKYYVSARGRVTTTDALTIRLRHGFTTIVSQVTPVQNQWYQLTDIVVPTDTQLHLTHTYSSSAVANGKLMEIQYVMVINLTQTFGAGNEPTKSEMDTLIEMIGGWFDGEISLTNKEALNFILGEIRKKANKQQEARITPTLLNGWKNLNAAVYSNIGYIKDEFGFVYLQGVIDGGTNDDIFLLPDSYRPIRAMRFNIVQGITLSSEKAESATIQILSTGVVQRRSQGHILHLDGIVFKAVD